jgi:acyl carrier protein
MDQKEQIVANLIGMVHKTLLKKDIEIAPDADFQKIGLDSMGIIEIATKLEEEYDIQFDDDDMKQIKTLDATADLLLRKIAQS